jgi:hypothetical protein
MLYKENLNDYKLIIEVLMDDNDLSKNIFQYFILDFSDDNFHKIIFNHTITENSWLEFRTVLAILVIGSKEEWDVYCNSILFLHEIKVYYELKIDYLTYSYLTREILDNEIKNYLFKNSEKKIDISLTVIDCRKHFAKKLLRFFVDKNISLKERRKIRDVFYEHCL